jgi:hypothetical protein
MFLKILDERLTWILCCCCASSRLPSNPTLRARHVRRRHRSRGERKGEDLRSSEEAGLLPCGRIPKSKRWRCPRYPRYPSRASSTAPPSPARWQSPPAALSCEHHRAHHHQGVAWPHAVSHPDQREREREMGVTPEGDDRGGRLCRGHHAVSCSSLFVGLSCSRGHQSATCIFPRCVTTPRHATALLAEFGRAREHPATCRCAKAPALP